MHIVHVTPEFAPLAKVGGLGEVLTGLAREQTRLGHTVEVILPKYSLIHESQLTDQQVDLKNFPVLEKGEQIDNTMWSAQAQTCHLLLLQAHHPEGYFQREKIYGYSDDLTRFLYFSKAVLEYLQRKKEPIDILHLHDWPTALCASFYKEFYQKELEIRGVCFTLHNGEYQGKGLLQHLKDLHLPVSTPSIQSSFADPCHPEQINLLKSAIVYTDLFITVSPTYSQEILSPPFGFSLEPFYREHQKKIVGVLNGIDTILWDPSQDPYIKTYPPKTSFETVRKAKKSNQRELIEKFHLSSKSPWIGAVTRLVQQKGPKLLIEAVHQTVALGGTFLLLGSCHDPALEEPFAKLKQLYQGHPQVFLHYEYDEALAHQIYAALDFLLVPSYFEPCGITQLIAMRYGTLPIVRSVGGLKDSVFDFENPQIPNHLRNGITFSDDTTSSLREALNRAMRLFQLTPSSFASLVQTGMQSDVSWKRSAMKYLSLYQNLL